MSASIRCFIQVDEPASGSPYTIASPNGLLVSCPSESRRRIRQARLKNAVKLFTG